MARAGLRVVSHRAASTIVVAARKIALGGGKSKCFLISMGTTRITYVGPAPYAGDLAREFAEQGLVADYDPPFERKDLATAMAAVSVVFSVTGSVPDIVAAARAFQARHNNVQIQGLPDAPQRSIKERLAELEHLRASHVVNDDEYRSQRERILGEL